MKIFADKARRRQCSPLSRRSNTVSGDGQRSRGVSLNVIKSTARQRTSAAHAIHATRLHLLRLGVGRPRLSRLQTRRTCRPLGTLRDPLIKSRRRKLRGNGSVVSMVGWVGPRTEGSFPPGFRPPGALRGWLSSGPALGVRRVGKHLERRFRAIAIRVSRPRRRGPSSGRGLRPWLRRRVHPPHWTRTHRSQG